MLGAELSAMSAVRKASATARATGCPRYLATQVGDIDLTISKLRSSSYPPSNLEPRRSVDQALYGFVMERYVGGIPTRKVDALVVAWAFRAASPRSQVSRIYGDIDV